MMSNIIQDANKYLHEKPTAFMTKTRKIDRAFVLIEKLVKEIERRDVVIEAAKILVKEIDYFSLPVSMTDLLDEIEKALSQLEDK